MKGKLIKFVDNEPMMHTVALDDRDMEILQDVLEAHFDNLYDVLEDCVVDEDTQIQYKDEMRRVNRILSLFDREA